MKAKIGLPEGFTNDGTYKCSQCEEGMMVFSSTGDTQFCPICGTRNMDFGEWNDEEDLEDEVQDKSEEVINGN